MTILHTCPACGFESEETRCPRCNALKVVGCSGGCSLCGSSCKTDSAPGPVASPVAGSRHTVRPSDEAIEDSEHSGTSLER